LCFRLYSEVGVGRKVERRLVIDEHGDAVLIETETTGVVVENEDGRAVAVQTTVRGVVLGNVRDDPSTPLITRASRDDEGCSCCCMLKWTLLTILCLPCLPFACIWAYCCSRDQH